MTTRHSGPEDSGPQDRGPGFGAGRSPSKRSHGRPLAIFAAVAVVTLAFTTPGAAAQVGAPAVSLSGPVLRSGARGPEVEALQRRLWDLAYDPGPVDGAFGQATEYAIFAFQKVHGLTPTGRVGDVERAALASPVAPSPLRPDGAANRVEVDLARQLLFLYRNGALELISHVSTGNGAHWCVGTDCRNAITPVGDFNFLWYVPGWEHSPLGMLYNPLYITETGIAIHGSTSVPLHPASHGCIRVPLHTAERLPDLVSIGEPVSVSG